MNCADIAPSIGTTSTPVIDSSTNTVYLTHKTYVSGTATWFMDALDVSTGQQRAGFPVRLDGSADNNPATPFIARNQQQRPGLLLMNGVVYAAFGAHCDQKPYQGWVFGVSTAGQVTARWVDVGSGVSGGGIWQSGVGLTSDRPGSLTLMTGNGGSPSAPAPGTSPPGTFGESVVRLHVQPDGSLAPADFFTPFDAATLDQYDSDFGSGALVGLPDAYFGTPAIPHLAVTVGKQGYVYLLNRDHLGGYDQGPGGGDDVVQRTGPHGGVWGRAGVWPGDGGYVYIPTSSGRSGGGALDVYKYGLSGTQTPSLSLVGSSADVFGWGSGSPVITSNGTSSGSALVWVIWSANRQGGGAQLRAYDPIPVNGQPVLRYSAPIGTSTNYSVPGVGAGRLYIGTRDGHVLGFGSPVQQPLSGSGLTFPATTIGSSRQQTLTLTANKDLTVSSLGSSSSQFTLGTPSRTLPATLAAGQTISVPVTFTPTQTGVLGGQINASTDAGDASFPASGTGQTAAAQLAVSPALLSLGGTSTGGHLSGTVTFSNVGATSLTINAVHLPVTPFTATNYPAAGGQIGPGSSITVNIAFDPTQAGAFTSSIGLDTNAGNKAIGLSASAGTPGALQFSSQNIDFGATPIGTSVAKTFTITNAGGTNVTITKSKPPFGGSFTATSSLPEGATITPGETVTEAVTFTPSVVGSSAGTWEINSDDSTGLHQVQFSGSGVNTPTSSSGITAPPTTRGVTTPTLGASARPGTRGYRAFAPKLATVTSIGKLRSLVITYMAMSPGKITRFTLQHATSGRRGAHGCVAVAPRTRRAPKCHRFVDIASFTHRDRLATNRVRLANDVSVSKLVPGTYRLRSIVTDAVGHRHSFYALFRIVP